MNKNDEKEGKINKRKIRVEIFCVLFSRCLCVEEVLDIFEFVLRTGCGLTECLDVQCQEFEAKI